MDELLTLSHSALQNVAHILHMQSRRSLQENLLQNNFTKFVPKLGLSTEKRWAKPPRIHGSLSCSW